MADSQVSHAVPKAMCIAAVVGCEQRHSASLLTGNNSQHCEHWTHLFASGIQSSLHA